MKYICHRVNTIEQLAGLSSEYGVEVDLRDGLDGRIYMEHEPFTPGPDFEEYLKNYHHGLMILNIKSERVELKARDLLQKYKITDYFFLDSTFPMIYLLSNLGEKRTALRLSEYEKIDTLRAMQGKVNWVWIDCFTKIPVTQKDIQELKAMGYKTCLVSPELEGRPDDINQYIQQIKELGLQFDAVCSKQYIIEQWKVI